MGSEIAFDFTKILNSPISKHFTWKEALWLPKWNRYGGAGDGFSFEVHSNLINLFNKMDTVRDYVGKPIIVHCAWRPAEYNKIVGGAKNSAHMALGHNIAAVDFHVKGLGCLDFKKKVLKEDKLVEWDMRMEDNGDTAGWIHLDTRPVNGRRYFPL